MANKKITELPMLMGRDMDIEADMLPVETSTGTKSILIEELLADVIAINEDLLNKCRVLHARVKEFEPAASNIIINQYYGGALKLDTGSVSHAFIELYNPTEGEVNLEGKSIHYIDSANNTWSKLPLTGAIPAKHSFLIRCKLTNDGTTTAPMLNLTDVTADMEWDTFLSNKGTTVALMNDTEDIPAETDPKTLDSYIDMIGASDDKGMAVPYYEGAPLPNQSKQKSVRRILFSDTDDNSKDCEIVDFRVKANLVKAPKTKADGAWE